MSNELWRRSARDLARMIAAREVSSREVVEAHIARIEAVNPKINAVVFRLDEAALAAADVADASPPGGPLHGVPFTIKENIDCTGSATTQGMPAFEQVVPSLDAPVVQRMKAAGAIPLARTNLPEMGLRIATDNPLRGRTLNPWDVARVAGGSSGGEGAALATGMTPIGLGNDIGGSLRNPAFCCGITSLKPTTGRIPWASSIAPEDPSIAFRLMAVEGPMARSVADLELGFRILAGWHPRDPFSVPASLTGPDVPRRAGLVTALPGWQLPPALSAAVRAAGEALASSGWQVEEVTPPELERVHEIWGHLLTTDLQPMVSVIGNLMSPQARALVDGLIRRYPPGSPPAHVVFSERHRLAKAWSSLFAETPIIVGPTWADVQFEHDADFDPHTGVDTTLDRLRFITPGNLLGLPSVAVPTGVANGLPTGVQIYAERWREDLALAAAAAVEGRIGVLTPIDPKF
jgi:amidase